ncbi:MAG: 3-dehydroquinate synthase [Clostridiales bacterium]|nr:3-dehydroquinate synthase [Clostridiales bacterium]
MVDNVILGASPDDVAFAIDSCDFVVTDSNVASIYPELSENAFVIPAGEKSKQQSVLFSIIGEMYSRGLTRGDRVAALGGGVVGDITGLAAALYMRGLEWINIPTTLLAQVDSGIGGKTAIDMFGVKNLVGAFYPPKKTFISYDFLDTLNDRERICGYGELIKTCLLKEDAYYDLLLNIPRLVTFERDTVYSLIEKAVAIKREVVKRDPKEKNLRAVLNVGHTVGHALESVDEYRLSHGEYVLKGMMTESAMFGDFVCRSFGDQLIRLCKLFTAPPHSTANSVVERAMGDKKNVGENITIMLPINAGDIVRLSVSVDEFAERYDIAIKQLRKS